MIKNYILTTLRSFWKNRSHTVINILGLSLGITCSILIFLILRFELSYDQYHAKKDRIYRVVTEFFGDDAGYTSGVTYPLPAALKNDFPDTDDVILVDANMSTPVISVIHKDLSVDRYKEERVAFVDPGYFHLFDYIWIDGNNDALRNEKTAVISESTAKKYFGNESAINKIISFNNKLDLTVTGVVKDPPLNTDFPFVILISSNLGADKRGWDNWGSSSSSLECYVLLKPTSTEEGLEAKMKDWHKKYFVGEEKEDAESRVYTLQPLSDVHFNTNFSNFGRRTVSKLTLLTLLLIGVVLLLTACINFVNLNTVLIISRAKEAGVRKMMGSTRTQLVGQFLSETFLITFISLLISTGLVELAILNITPQLGYKLQFAPLSDAPTLTFLIVLPLIVTMLSGLYPGITLSRFQPVRALKNKLSGNSGSGMTLRRSLIVFQLVISQVLIVCTIIAVQQLDHFTKQPLGIKSSGVVEFDLPGNKAETIHTLRERLQQVPGVISATMSNTGSTSGNTWGGNAEVTLDKEVMKVSSNIKFGDHNFVKTFGLKILYGEDLLESDTANRFLVNVALTKALGLDDPSKAIGLPINVWGNRAIIAGVVNDFNTNSLHRALQPTVIFCGTGMYQRGAVRINTADLKTAMAGIQKTWEGVYSNYVFEYKFLDETIAEFYDGERRSTYLIGVFAVVAIVIGCIGLYGLISFMAKAKTKEVGIRKTLGATIPQVISLFSKEFVILIGISFVISAPLAWYFMDGWLENFEYRVHPGFLTFIIGIVVTFIVVLSTVGIKSYRAAVANPVDSLRDE